MFSSTRRPTILALIAALASCAAPSGFTSGDLAEIETQARLWADAVVAGETDAIVAIYEEDAVVLPDGAPPVVGREAIGTFFASLPDVRGVKLNLVEINGHGPLAYVLGTYRMKLTQAGSTEPVLQFGRYVEIWRRHGGGRWLIARDLYHTLDDAPAEFTIAPTAIDPTPADLVGDANADGDAP